MYGKRYDTPEYAWELLKEFFGPLKGAAQTAAGMVSPGPNTLGAAGVAGIRSMLPGSGTYQQELDRYNQAAAPQDSVTDRVPMPGEDQFDAMKRWVRSPQAEREVMQTSTMAAPIAVHASPNKWVGQPQRSMAGTGEGGAAYGEGLYATVPSNAKGVDARYRESHIDNIGSITIGNEVPGAYARRNNLDSFSPEGDALSALEQHARHAKGDPVEELRSRWQAVIDNELTSLPKDEYARRLAFLDRLKSEGLRYRPPEGGSFHVWDVPDTLLDYDNTLASSRAAFNSLRKAGAATVMQDGRVVALPEGPMGAGRIVGDSVEVTGKDMVRALGEDKLRASGVQGHTYAGEAGSARTSGIEGDVPNFVIYDDAAIKPLGTFGSAEEFLASELYKQLKPRIDAEEALRASGQATPDAYAELRRRFGGE